MFTRRPAPSRSKVSGVRVRNVAASVGVVQMSFPGSLAQRRRSEVSASSRAWGATDVARPKRDPNFIGGPPHHHVSVIVPLTMLSNWIAPLRLTLALSVDEVHGQLSHADLHTLLHGHHEEVEVVMGLLGRTLLDEVVVDSIFELRQRKGVSRSNLSRLRGGSCSKVTNAKQKPWGERKLA